MTDLTEAVVLPTLFQRLRRLAPNVSLESMLAQLFGYGVAIAGLLDVQHRLPRPFRLAAFVLVTLAGMSVGLWQFLRGQSYSQWNPEQNR
ncbi:hypothetical protein D3C72_2274560 [compost metagenome]